ncbi:MAG: LPS assembly protein LptD, partial [Actinomycetota bacterium]|nr:LPS assembly protein LptD [Actinomycetota bacterium]
MHADSAVISAGRDRLVLSGHVLLLDPAMTIEADSAELTLDGSGSHIVNTRYALHAQHIRGSASEIRRENEYSVTITGGAYTTCEPGHEAWALASRRIHLDQEAGWGSASHVRLLINRAPVLYVPYITFPIDKRRRSGVLYPTFSFSDDNGTDIAVPYYFNLDPQFDLLLTPRWIENRGGLVEGELRYLLGAPNDSYGSGSLGVGWIGSDRAYNDEQRHVLRFQHLGDPTPDWQVLADATDVSDDDYFDDLDTQLSVNRDAHLVRVLQTRYAADNWSGLARVQGWQTINPAIAESDQPYERTPQLLANIALPAQHGLVWGATTEYVYFDRTIDPSLANPVGSRVRLEPSVRRPFTGEAWRIEPAAKARYTAYSLENGTASDTPEHLLPTVTLDSALFLERDFRLHDNDWLQTLEPRAFLAWTPYKTQDDAPLFDTSPLTFGYDQLFR